MHHIRKPAEQAFETFDYPDNAIFFFDFDGVLADQVEEKVFRLEGSNAEHGHLEMLARMHGIDHTLYPNTRYLRHLLHQTQAYGYPVKPHLEAVDFARELSMQQKPYFIVTARSGFYAVRRMISFCKRFYLYPQEVFCLGRSSKALLLAELRKDWPERPFIFFEDSEYHIEAAKALGDPNLTIVQIEWPTCSLSAEELRRQIPRY